MPYHLYVKPDGYPDVTEFKYGLELLPGYRYVGEFAERPTEFDGRKYVNGRWVWGGSEPEYVFQRDRAFPRVKELLEALFWAMDRGELPKVSGFYDRIKAVHDRFPTKK